MNNQIGKLIVIEGPEGSGTTTIAKMVVEFLSGFDIRTVYTHEPGGTEAAEVIRGLLRSPNYRLPAVAQLLLFAGARNIHIKDFVKPMLAEGVNVVTDRFNPSTFVYQGGMEEVSILDIERIDAIARAGIKADLTVILIAEIEETMKRLKEKLAEDDTSWQDQMGREWQERLTDQYRFFAREFNWPMIDSSGPAEETFQKVVPHLETLFERTFN